MVQSMVSQRIPDGGAVAIVVASEVYDSIVGPGVVARQISSMQVASDPTVELYRQALQALTAVGAGGQGGIAAGIGGAWVFAEALPIASNVLAATFKCVKGMTAGGPVVSGARATSS